MYGPNGNPVSKITWEEYTKWQRWDEFPERADNPPLTVETDFWYNNHEYLVTSLNGEYVIVTMPDFDELIISKNFLELLTIPFIDGKSFKELINDFLFEV